MRSILLFKKLLGLVEMTSGLVNVSFSLPEWQAVKMIFFAPCFKIKHLLLPHVIFVNLVLTYAVVQFYPWFKFYFPLF